ncbi:MAG: helix-turn-helix transcriptional regulator [Syntrophorhabdales bacterium]|jgi:transcriptional regulator with XRE-family HTH domain
MSLGAKLKDLRAKKGESLRQVANAIGSSKAHIWELETGKSRNPGTDSLNKLADHFKVSVGFLVGEDPQGEDQKPEVVAMFRQLTKLSVKDQGVIRDMIESLNRRAAEEKSDKDEQD